MAEGGADISKAAGGVKADGPSTPPHQPVPSKGGPSTAPSAPAAAELDQKWPEAGAQGGSGGKRKMGRAVLYDSSSVWASIQVDGSKRARRRPTRFLDEAQISTEEEQSLHQAIQNSRIETKIQDTIEIPEVKTYHPTHEEFSDPIRFIESIRVEGERWGVVKIVPPEGWAPPPVKGLGRGKSFPTRRQQLKRFKEGNGFDEGRRYTLETYREQADAFHDAWVREHYTSQGLPPPTYEQLERDYWRVVETGLEDVTVEYANDLDTLEYGSGFPRRADLIDGEGNFRVGSIGEGVPEGGPGAGVGYYERCGWNLNNMPLWPSSMLRTLRAPLKGVNVPWLYVGMLFSTFCWHNEDNYLYSVNYMHEGAPKQWYTVPGGKAEALERVMKGFLREAFREVPDLLHHMTTLFCPMVFQRAGVPVYRALQTAGTFIVTFPKSFHAGFSYGHNCAEAVNFASPDWLQYGREAIVRYRRFGRPSVFSHDRLVMTLATAHLGDFSLDVLRRIHVDLKGIILQEAAARKQLRQAGVRFDLVDRSKLFANNLSYMDTQSSDYDDKRICFSCKHICFLSAVACQCSATKVACPAEASILCQCPMDSRFFMAWHEMDELYALERRVEEFIEERGGPGARAQVVQVEPKHPHDG